MSAAPDKSQPRQTTTRTTSQLSSHGRGGAGNMADPAQTSKLKPSDLETPTLKKPVVTTGRGGTGNMAKNDDPKETRLRQDVQAVPRRYSSGAQHSGRGGAGNIFRETEDSNKLARKPSQEQAIDDSADSKDTASPEPEANAAKRKNWIFGKKV